MSFLNFFFFHILFYWFVLFFIYLFIFISFAISWNFNFAVNLVTSLSCQKKVKIEKQKLWNTKFYHPAKFELKRIKSVKVVLRMHF